MRPGEILKMEKVCQLAAETLKLASKLVQPGVTTMQINDHIHDHILSIGARPAPLNYHGFPKSICTSVNDMVCHGVPRIDELLKPGDIVNVDVTLELDGYYGDTSRTFFVGEVSEKAKKITQAAQEAMYAGIAEVKAGRFTGDIGYATEQVVKLYGFHVVRDIGGHGIGRKFHMSPFVPGHGTRGTKERLRNNTCITVEPMINENSHTYTSTPIPNSTITEIKTRDGSLSAQFEHTVLVTKTGYHILTEW